MRSKSVAVVVTAKQSRVLQVVVRAKLSPQQMVERCRIVLLSADGRDNLDQADVLGVDRQRVRRWRYRWAQTRAALADAEEEGASDKDLEKLNLSVLADDEGSGAPPKFTPEQTAAIVALACEQTAESGLPVSHWTPPELAREGIKRKIVESISPRQVDGFLATRTSGRTRVSTG